MSRLPMGPPADDPSLPRRCAARNRASIRRAMRAASAVPISPCDNADQTRRMARCTCARVRIDDRRRPIRSAGSCADTGGRNWPRSRRNSQGWRLNKPCRLPDFAARPAASPCAASGSGCRAAAPGDCRNALGRIGRPCRGCDRRPGRGPQIAKDQNQAIDFARFRFRNAAKSRQKQVNRQ